MIQKQSSQLFQLGVAVLLTVSGSAFFFSGSAQAEEGEVIVKDSSSALEWQRVDLEDRLQSKITKSISAGLQATPFVVNVSISLKPRDPQAAQIEESPETVDPGERIPLGKLDIDAPIFKSKQRVHESEVSSDADANLFQNIEKVRVAILLDSAITDAKKELVQRLSQSALSSLAPEQIDLSVEKADLAAKEEKDIKKWLIEFKLPIGFLLATLIFSLLILILARGFRNIESRKLSIMEAQNSRQQEEHQSRSEQVVNEAVVHAAVESTGGPSVPNGAFDSRSSESSTSSGFEKFQLLLKESPEQASNLIKQWVKTPVKEARDALSALPQVLSTEEFLVIFQHLPIEDRKIWRRVLSTGSGTENLNAANQYISSQIVDTLLGSTPDLDDELKKMLSELDAKETVEIATQSPELGGLLVNLLPTPQVSEVYATIATELANQITLSSLKYSSEKLKESAPRLKQAIQQVKAKVKPQAVPFLEKTAELFSQLTPDKEGSIFKALAETEQYSLLESTAQQFFPADLIFSLPEPLLKACLDRFALPKRAEFLASRPEADRTILANAAGKEGSKLRDLLDLEVQQVFSDPTRQRKAEKTKENLWKEFVQNVRTRIRTNEIAAEQAEPVLNAWLSEKSKGQLGGQTGVQGHEATSPAV